jgi:hypothetical protein
MANFFAFISFHLRFHFFSPRSVLTSLIIQFSKILKNHFIDNITKILCQDRP